MTANDKPVIWTANEVAQVLGVTFKESWSANGVSIDSRSVQDGDLFVAIAGPNFDAHQFVVEALANGAVGAIVHCDPNTLTRDPDMASRMIQVSDTLRALELLATHARDRSAAKIIAITGSVGKTGCKEMLKLALSEQGRTTASIGNLNNHWGLPLSLARMPKETEFGIFEMGMNHAQEIRPLSLITKPDVCLITNVELVHSEFFASVEHIAAAKAEILAGLKPDGVAVLNYDNAMFDQLKSATVASGQVAIKTFGESDGADFKLISTTPEFATLHVVANINGNPISFGIGIPGRHWAINAMGVLATVDAVGGDVGQAAAKLQDMHGITGRGACHEVEIEGGSFLLIDESYNASPIAMSAALDVLGQMPVTDAGRRIAVLGDMLELGEEAEKFHCELKEPLLKNGVDLVFTAGQYMARLWDALPPQNRGGHAMTARQLAPLVIAALKPGDVVSVKGSLGSKTGIIVSQLLNMSSQNDQRPHRSINCN